MLNTFLPCHGPPPAGGAGQPPQSPVFMFGWMAIMIAMFYFMLIRPQRRREKERQQLLKAIKTGDRVLFAGGIIGVVTNVKEKTYVIKVADKTKMEVLRGRRQPGAQGRGTARRR
jgi:preprotein translocase subunit YajC